MTDFSINCPGATGKKNLKMNLNLNLNTLDKNGLKMDHEQI